MLDAAGNSGPVATLLTGLLMVGVGIISVVFRSTLWGGQDRRYLEKRSARGQGPGFPWFV
jgi:hypothetical protein